MNFQLYLTVCELIADDLCALLNVDSIINLLSMFEVHMYLRSLDSH